MAAPFPEKATALRFQMPNEIDPLHTSSGAQAFSDYRLPDEVLFRQRAIGLEHECHGLTQMRARLLECCTLRVRAGQLFHEGDIPALRGLAKHGREFKRHGSLLHSGNVAPCLPD